MPVINFEPTRTDPQIAQIMAPNPNAYALATAGFRGMEAADARFEKEQQQRDAAAEKERQAYKAMLDDPQNAEYIAANYGVAYTPVVQQMLKQPQMMKNIITAQEYAKGMGITNPAATQKMMMKAAELGAQGQAFNPLEIMGAPGKTPLIKPPQPKYAGGNGSGKVEKAVKPWEDMNVPPELRIEGQMLSSMVASGAAAVDGDIQRKITDYNQRVAPYMTGAERFRQAAPPGNVTTQSSRAVAPAPAQAAHYSDIADIKPMPKTKVPYEEKKKALFHDITF